MKNKILICLLFVLPFASAFAQPYKTGVGIRFSPGFFCIDAKHFLSEKVAVEGMLNIKPSQITLVALAEYEKSIEKVEGLSWFLGGGGAIRFPSHSPIVISIDGIIGLEYTFAEVPINLCLDWKPAVEVINGSNFYPGGWGLGVRYVFK